MARCLRCGAGNEWIEGGRAPRPEASLPDYTHEAAQETEDSTGEVASTEGLGQVALNLSAAEIGAQLARALFMLGGTQCCRIEFKLGRPGDERPGGGMEEEPLARFLTARLESMQRRALNEPAA